MRYELWDIEARFFLGRFESEAEALKFVRVVLENEGDAYADKLELVVGEDGARNLSGGDLVRSAQTRHREDDAQEARRPAYVGSRIVG